MPLFYSLWDLKKKDSEKILIQLNISKILHLLSVSVPGSQHFKELCGALGSCCVVTQNANIKLGVLTGLLFTQMCEMFLLCPAAVLHPGLETVL